MKQRYRTYTLGIVDLITINLSMIFAYLLRFEGVVHNNYVLMFTRYFMIISIIKILVFHHYGLYRSLWKYASVKELISILMATSLANVLSISFIGLTQELFMGPRYFKFNISIYILTWILDTVFIASPRFAYRVIRQIHRENKHKKKSKKKALIVGAGDASAIVIKEMITHKNLNITPVAIVDDDPLKQNKHIYGIPVIGTRNDIINIVNEKDIDNIIIAIPSLSGKDRQEIIEICKNTKSEIKLLPGVYELIEGKVTINQLRKVEIEDLLGRDPVKVDLGEISNYIRDSIVMVTGGGGSIGSELCRQVAKINPKKLIICDIYENNVYDIQNELKRKYPNLDICVLIASIRDRKRIFSIFEKYNPQVVFHAAAHKHVPLMEDSAMEAVKNNVFGTFNVVEAAHEYGVKRFVQISTDKAVNPTNVMGATKRICEMIIQAYAKVSNTEFVAVRFGNVLGSNGSVIPLFKKQIAMGGPVTVTHPDIIRYFMTIPEAVQLVIQAGGMAKGGEIFVLDMGEPVKIDKLARDLIRLSGLEPDEDIKIEYTGLRPGEKLYEELLMEEEGLTSTVNEKIFVAKPMNITLRDLKNKLNKLGQIIHEDSNNVIKVLQEVVPTYKNVKR